MNYSKKIFLGDRPYEDYEEYFNDLSLYIMICLRKFLEDSFGTFDKNRKESELLPGYDEVIEILDFEFHKAGLDDDQEAEDWYTTMTGRRELSGELGIIFPIDDISEKMSLGEFGIILLITAILGTTHPKLQRYFQFICRDNNRKHPDPWLCARLYYLGETVSDIKINQLIYSHSSMLQLLFPELSEAENLMLTELVCDERLIDLIFGKVRYYTRGVTVTNPDTELDPILFREEELTRISVFGGTPQQPLYLIYGEKGAGKKHLVSHYERTHGSSTVFLDISPFVNEESLSMNRVLAAIRFAARECIINKLPLAVTGLELLKEKELNQLTDFIGNSIKNLVPAVYLLVNREQYTTGIQGIYIIELKSFTELQRIELWKLYTRNYRLEENCSLDKIANTFIITPGQIIGAIRQASLLSGGNAEPIKEKLLYQACYAQLQHKLAEKTSRVSTDFSWEDLKIPESDKEILRDVCNCVKNKHIVMNEWNFSRIIPYGAGLTVLFSGPPGTGKTMAAQVVANELKMELYKIDLSQIFDKYVGETEKNIRQIFDQAKKSNSILFFDEADAIFNKRLEAATSNDRFANIESSLLLQCIEEYSGISILATNNYNSIDPAFIRRFKYYILFREPEEAVRYEIWKSVIPKEAPVSEEVDLKLLAKQFQFTGAVIKNVVISSAYLAAEKGEPISLIDILISIKREMFKNNLILTKEKLGSLGYLFEDIK